MIFMSQRLKVRANQTHSDGGGHQLTRQKEHSKLLPWLLQRLSDECVSICLSDILHIGLLSKYNRSDTQTN